MTKNRFKWSAMTAAFVAASLAGSVALAAQTEAESADNCNNTIAQATPLDVDGSGVAVVNGSIINGAGYNGGCETGDGSQYSPARDIDFYSFTAKQGDTLDIAISNAWDWSTYYTWTVLGVFGPADSSTGLHSLKYQVGDALEPSISGFHADKDGTYYVGVSSQPGLFVTGSGDGKLVTYSYQMWSPDAGVQGSYTLTVKGARPSAPAVLAISIEVKPGDNNTTVLDASGVAQPAALRGTARGHLPVALLSSEKDNFYPMDVQQGTLYFGATGKEDSLVSCNGGHGQDVNKDGIPDLICHFDLKKANFALSESEGILTGKTGDGRDFEGKGWLKTVTIGLTPEKMGFGRKK